MPSLAHLIFALGYTVAAIAVALMLRMGTPGLDRLTAALAGAVVFLFGALIHEVAARSQRDKAVARWLARLRSADEEVASGLDQLQDELRGLRGGAPAAPRQARPARPATPERAAASSPAPGAAAGPAPAAASASASAAPPRQPRPAAAEPAMVDAAGAGAAEAAGAATRAAERASVLAELRSLKDVLGRLRPRPPEPPPRAEPVVELPADGAGTEPAGLFPDRAAERGAAAQAAREAAVTEAVRATLAGERIEAMVQPVMALPQRRHRYSAVFPRLRLSDGSLVGPELYQPVAVRESMVAFIDNLLLFRAIQLAREAERRGTPQGVLCAISPDALAEPAFLDQFMQFMEHNQTLAARLTFVLPQSELLDDESPSLPAREELARMGFRFAMDSALHLDFDAPDLTRRHVRFLILDAPMLLDPIGPLGGIDSALALKHELDRNAVDLVISGIETEQQLVELLDLRLDLGQGPLFGEPKPLT
ncbi:EAL domain-containing protein [Arenibaculum pallidiluteum]|uniref:EAL domain-containing protein n=1 Tax=Arenibaculum pallidiluteum TaxID=2812559 RepID=UPI001A958040|nr:EAL domain-containing protein [Arenibaculum pallidiluteum]